MKREATCACGGLKVSCAGDPALVSLCHCVACQRRTGAPFGVAAFFPRETVEISGADRRFERSSDAGYGVRFHFCGDCGSTVFWEPSRMPDLLAVAVGSFGDPAFPAPSQEVHADSRHEWIEPF